MKKNKTKASTNRAKWAVISCEKCDIHYEFPVENMKSESHLHPLLNIYPFLPASFLCVKCGQTAIIEVIEKEKK